MQPPHLAATARSKLSSHFKFKFSPPHPNIKIVQSLRRFISPVAITRPRRFAFGAFSADRCLSLLFRNERGTNTSSEKF
jgi:hypothetical protein